MDEHLIEDIKKYVRGGIVEDEVIDYKYMTGMRFNGMFNQKIYECTIRSEVSGKLLSRQWGYTKEEALENANRLRF